MRVTYDWTQAEWNEAVTLATEQRRRGSPMPGMVYALVGIPLVGAVMDGVRSVRGTGKLTGAGVAVPLLLLALAAFLAGVMLFSRWQRRQRLRAQAPMPQGQWEAVLQESGWKFQEKAAPVETGAVLPTVTAEATACDSSHEASQVADSPVSKDAVDADDPAADVQGAAYWTAPSGPGGGSGFGGGPTARAVKSARVAVQRLSRAFRIPVVRETGQGEATDRTADLRWIELPDDIPEADGTPEAMLFTGSAVPVDTPEEKIQVQPDALPGARSSAGDLHPWKHVTGSRAGERVIVLLHRDGFHAVPVRCMTPDQASHMNRMVIRKLRPLPPPR